MWSYRGFSPYHSCCCHGAYGPFVPFPWWPWPAGWHTGWPWPGPEPCPPACVAKELTADSANPTRNAVVGGTSATHLTLEYEADSGATSPSVKVTITDASGTAAWNLTGFPAGYHVKREFARVEPGAQLKLEAAGSTAHLRWFEYVS